jgi:hypothetical protein
MTRRRPPLFRILQLDRASIPCSEGARHAWFEHGADEIRAGAPAEFCAECGKGAQALAWPLTELQQLGRAVEDLKREVIKALRIERILDALAAFLRKLGA